MAAHVGVCFGRCWPKLGDKTGGRKVKISDYWVESQVDVSSIEMFSSQKRCSKKELQEKVHDG